MIAENIQLYQGCFVKTANGDVIGPIRATFERGSFAGAWGVLRWSSDGVGYDFTGICGPLQAIAVYPSLSAAAAANPEL